MNLTEEEKEILQAEGLPIPTTLPLTKVCNHYRNNNAVERMLILQIEEKALKNVRRKIRNRVSVFMLCADTEV